jgi:hypothetical protein
MRHYLAAFLILMAGVAMLTGCSTIRRETHFTPCANPQCPQCHGDKTYKCSECLGRGSVQCRSCGGSGTLSCYKCGGTGMKGDLGCVACGRSGRIACYTCNRTGMAQCKNCHGKGMVQCGTTSYTWVCRQCGTRFDYPAKTCPKCGAT